jgi:hypothetical protein
VVAVQTSVSTLAMVVEDFKETEAAGVHTSGEAVDMVVITSFIAKGMELMPLVASGSRISAKEQSMEGQIRCRTTPSSGDPVVVHKLYHRVLQMQVRAL